jgi:hypothetical protein
MKFVYYMDVLPFHMQKGTHQPYLSATPLGARTEGTKRYRVEVEIGDPFIDMPAVVAVATPDQESST